jgi:sugar O-acyltransferase (sialic acid O-acetyltransferase NeuD family)
MENLILYGNGSVAEVLHYHFTTETNYQIVAFTVDRHLIHENTFHGVPLVPWDEVQVRFPPADHRMMIAVGYVQGNRLRADRVGAAKEMGYGLVSYVSPKASLWDGFLVGENCRISEYARIEPYAFVGDNVFIGSGALVGHHSVIQEHCHLSANVCIAGHVIVEPYSFIGINATIRDNVKIAHSCVIGAGAVILGNTIERGIYMSRQADLLPMSSDRLSPR